MKAFLENICSLLDKTQSIVTTWRIAEFIFWKMTSKALEDDSF